MANLIITVISIALIAVAALMGIYYGGEAFSSNKVTARAAMLLSQSQQMWLASQQYMLDKVLNSFNDFGPDNPVISNYTNGRISLLNLDAIGSNGLNGFPAPNTASTVHKSCVPNQVAAASITYLDGLALGIYRANCGVNNNNAIVYRFFTPGANCDTISTSVDFAAASAATHPLVQMCLKINSMTTLPGGLTLAASGLPYGQGSLQYCRGNSSSTSYLSGAGQYNYCYLNTTSGSSYSIHYVFVN